MKSRTILESKAHEEEFKNVIHEVDADRLETLKKSASGILQNAFAYFDAQSISLDDLAYMDLVLISKINFEIYCYRYLRADHIDWQS